MHTTTDVAQFAPPRLTRGLNRLPADTFETCELFFGRMILSGLDWGDITLALTDVDKPSTFEGWDDWHRRFAALGQAYERRARQAFDEGRIASARFATRRAAACWHFSEFMYVDNPAVKVPARAHVTEVFERGRQCLRHPTVPFRVRYRGNSLPGYVITPGPGPWPAVIIVNGLDSAKEVELYAFAEEFVARGVAAVVFDGPGQGVLAGKVPMVVEFEDVVAAVLDELAVRPEIDQDRVGIFGVSFGGYLAARAAAHHPRLRCCVNFAGGFDHDHFAAINVMVRKGFRFVFGVDDDDEMNLIATRRLHLRDTPRLRAPLLAIEGEQSDVITMSAVERMAEWAAGETKIVAYEGERHVATNRFGESIPLVADWIAEALRPSAARLPVGDHYG